MARAASHLRSAARHARPPAVAGMFYPADPAALRALVGSLIDGGEAHVPAALRERDVHAVIAPHAGFAFSGPIAGSAFAAVRTRRVPVRRVVHIGPSHYVAFEGVAVPESDTCSFATPLGEVALDRDALDRVLQLPDILPSNVPHEQEHALETHLPFLQEIVGEFAYVPMVFGDADVSVMEQAIDSVYEDDSLIVISSDLSHYLDHAAAKNMDQATAGAIERLAPEEIGVRQACGRLAIQALLQCARQRGWSAHTLDLRNSGDVAGGRDRVVGYGAFAFA